jgi:flagellin
MSLRIAYNGDAQTITRQLRVSSDRMSVAMQRLSSGLRINSAADDAAGLGISERLRGQIRGLEQANRNIHDGISMLQTMEAALDTVTQILHRARDLAVQYNNGTYSWGDKGSISTELIALSDEIARIEATTYFNGIPLLQDATVTLTLQVGANQGDTVLVSLVDLFGAWNTVKSISFFTVPWLEADITGMDANIADVQAVRGRLGAYVNRLEHTLNTNQSSIENLMAAESRIRDLDIAVEMTALVKQQLLQRSGMAMLAHANGGTASQILHALRPRD